MSRMRAAAGTAARTRNENASSVMKRSKTTASGAAAASAQGLTPVHLSAHLKRLLRDTLGGQWSFSDQNG